MRRMNNIEQGAELSLKNYKFEVKTKYTVQRIVYSTTAQINNVEDFKTDLLNRGYDSPDCVFPVAPLYYRRVYNNISRHVILRGLYVQDNELRLKCTYYRININHSKPFFLSPCITMIN